MSAIGFKQSIVNSKIIKLLLEDAKFGYQIKIIEVLLNEVVLNLSNNRTDGL